MYLKKAVNLNNDISFLIDSMNFKTSVGKKLLLNSHLLTYKEHISVELSNINWTFQFITDKSNIDILNLLFLKLQSVLDIYSSINRLKDGILDEIELFEIKKFAIISNEIKDIFEKINIKFVILPELSEVIKILDPDNQKIPHFYIYSSYDENLSKIRNLIQRESDVTIKETLRIEASIIEDKIKEDLSIKLAKFYENLLKSLNTIAYVDMIFAKAELSILFNLAMPQISDNNTSYTGLFNPYIKTLLKNKNKDFQAVNIDLKKQPCLLTGVNMGGKTVLLKTLFLSQLLFQFGFFVPATNANISIADEIYLISGDNQSELSGLSSFASEMLILNNVIKSIKSKKNLFVLIDELARTTNPDEGKAIVSATIDILNKYNVMSIISTHYSNLIWKGRRLKIKGLSIIDKDTNIDFKNLSNYMDYSIIEDLGNDDAKQALTIAKILGVDTDLINFANEYLK